MNPRTFIVPVAVLLAGGQGDRLLACATCFGASDSKMAEGMNMGILFLLGVVGLVVGGITLGFVGLAVRAARAGAVAGGETPKPGSGAPSA